MSRGGSVRARARSTGVEPVSPGPSAPISTSLIELNPKKIQIVKTGSAEVARMQPLMSQAIWRPYGRRVAFKVMHETSLLGIVFLTCPVLQLAARDVAFNETRWPGMLPLPGRGKCNSIRCPCHIRKLNDPSQHLGDQRMKILKHYAEMSICVATQPIGWYWNLGKLCALLATTLNDEWEAHEWASEPSHVDLKGITTTSLWGKSSQYNRIYRDLGSTKGFGHEQISKVRMAEMMQWLRDHRKENCTYCRDETPHPQRWDTGKTKLHDECRAVPGAWFGAGANARMRRILAYRKFSGDDKKDEMAGESLFHGKQRGVYYAPAVPTSERPRVIQDWYDRWGYPRYLRTKDLQAPYQDGLTKSREFVPVTMG